jgi:hypothetical protein
LLIQPLLIRPPLIWARLIRALLIRPPLIRARLIRARLIRARLIRARLIRAPRPAQRQGLESLGSSCSLGSPGSLVRARRQRIESLRRASRRLRRLSGWQGQTRGLRIRQRSDFGVFKPKLDDVGREYARPALGHETLHIWLALMAVECGPFPVNLVKDPLHWSVRDEVNDVHQSVRFSGPDLLRGLLGEPIEIGDPVIQQRENQNPAIGPSRPGH